MDWRRKQDRNAAGEPAGPRLSDARITADGAAARGRDPQYRRKRRFRRHVTVFVFCSVFVAGSVTTLFGKGGYLELRRLRADCASTAEQVREQRQRVAALEQRAQRLKLDPLERERIAREELGFHRQGELTFLLPRQPEPQPDGGIPRP